MNFKRKEGDPVLFGQFVKEIMGEMEKFMEPPSLEEELTENFEDEEESTEQKATEQEIEVK